MLLDTTTRTLELLLGTAQTTTAMSIVVTYVETTSTTHLAASSNSASNGTTAVTILSAPAASTQRKVNSLSVYNADSVAKIVTIRLNDNTTLRPIVVITLSVGDTLSYTDTNGWKVTDSMGNVHTAVTDAQISIAAGKTFTVNNSLTLSGTDGTTMTFPTTSDTLARDGGDSANVFEVATATAASHAVRLDQTVGRNKYVNGAYQVSQVNVDAAHTITAGAAINYGIDQWYTQSTGQNITAQRIAGTAPFRYAYKLSAGATGPTTTLHGQRIEGKNVAFLENGDVAVKVNIVGDVARTVTWTAYYATVEDTFSTKTQIATGSISATATNATYQFTFNAGANAKLGIAIEYTTSALTNSTGYITYSGHQLESGVVSSSYEYRKYNNELFDCMVYRRIIQMSIGQAQSADHTYSIGSTLLQPPMMSTPTLASGSFTVNTGASGTLGLGGIFGATTKNNIHFTNTAANWTIGAYVEVNANIYSVL